MLFADTKLNEKIKKAILDLGFTELTPVQKEAIPYLINHEEDLIALAQTGTGKTAAFGLPIIHKINANNKTTQAIVLCPTRELCLQITRDIQSYSKYYKTINTTAVYGGANISTQINSLKKGSQIIIGTPGRVIDLIKRKVLKLQNIEFIILDEADEMLNMGFKEDLDFILAETPAQKQTLLFSATMPREVMRISKNYMVSPKTIEIASRNEGTKNVEHHYYLVNARDKYKALRRICDLNPNIYGIIFCRTRRETASIADKLMQDGYDADAIHGELSQAQRDHVMARFRDKKLQLLVATDVAARGIDINELTHVINYNLPDDNEVYVHRSGRTGRAGNKGISVIIAHNRDGRKLKAIEKMIKRSLILKKVPHGNEICQIQLMNLIEKVVSTEINPQINQYIDSIEKKLTHLNKEEIIKHFVSAEFNRFLSFYENAPDLNIKNNIKKEKNNKGERKIKGRAEKGYTRFFINIGKNQTLQTHNLIGLINERTKNRDMPIGKIDIMRNFSFFETPQEFENIILSSLNKANWNGNRVKVEISKEPKNINKESKSEKFQNKRKKSTPKNRKSSFKDRLKASRKRQKK